ncbi:MAG: hypothetical protein RR376_03365 [Janthinobacterium sp.]
MLDMGFFCNLIEVAIGPGRIVPPGKGKAGAGMKNGGPQAAVLIYSKTLTSRRASVC